VFSIEFDDRKFMRDMLNVIGYSEGFATGAKSGVNDLLQAFGIHAVDAANEYIDSNSKVNPAKLQHVYEWGMTGNASGRLFELKDIVNGNSLRVQGSLKQSFSVKDGSKEPFYNKAEVMERGLPVKVEPRSGSVLTFDIDGETVFTKKPVVIKDPGGELAQNGFEETFNEFFNMFFSQSFLQSGRLAQYLSNPEAYHKNFKSAKSGGKSLGKTVGRKWMKDAGGVA
jgi:hypothetical protein